MISSMLLGLWLYIISIKAASFTAAIHPNIEAAAQLLARYEPGHSRSYEEVLHSRRLQASLQSPLEGRGRYSKSEHHRVEISVSLPMRSRLT